MLGGRAHAGVGDRVVVVPRALAVGGGGAVWGRDSVHGSVNTCGGGRPRWPQVGGPPQGRQNTPCAHRSPASPHLPPPPPAPPTRPPGTGSPRRCAGARRRSNQSTPCARPRRRGRPRRRRRSRRGTPGGRRGTWPGQVGAFAFARLCVCVGGGCRCVGGASVHGLEKVPPPGRHHWHGAPHQPALTPPPRAAHHAPNGCADGSGSAHPMNVPLGAPVAGL